MAARCVASSWQCQTTVGEAGAVAVTMPADRIFSHRLVSRPLQVGPCRAGPRTNLELTISDTNERNTRRRARLWSRCYCADRACLRTEHNGRTALVRFPVQPG